MPSENKYIFYIIHIMKKVKKFARNRVKVPMSFTRHTALSQRLPEGIKSQLLSSSELITSQNELLLELVNKRRAYSLSDQILFQ